MSAERNLVKAWQLRSFAQKTTAKGRMLSCAMNGRKKDDGTYEKSLNMSVFIGNDCDVDAELGDDLSNKYITVDGRFAISEYESKDGTASVSITIFADKIVKTVFEKQG
jgi:hypothetical protein